uniref:terminase small subunit n=1 Tax=Jeotgalibaca porci TaxID=1868793 RepID=UPI0035A0EB30
MSNDKLTKRQQAFEMYKEHKGKIDLVEIANSLGSPPGTVRGWKSKDKWDEALGGTFQPKKRNAPKKKPERSSKKKERSIEKPVELVIDNDDQTEAQKMFCLYYLKSFNATKAYMQAYQCDYWVANANGSRLLAKASIKKELHRLKAELQQDVFIGVGDIVQNYAKQAVADITDYVTFGKREIEVTGMFGPIKDEDGKVLMKEVNYVDFRESDLVDGSVIKNVRMGKDGPVIELYDKQKAMSELMKYLAGDDGPGEIENDGFIEALESEGEALWSEDE